MTAPVHTVIQYLEHKQDIDSIEQLGPQIETTEEMLRDTIEHALSGKSGEELQNLKDSLDYRQECLRTQMDGASGLSEMILERTVRFLGEAKSAVDVELLNRRTSLDSGNANNTQENNFSL